MIMDTTSTSMITKSRCSFSIASILGEALSSKESASQAVTTSSVSMTRNDELYSQLSQVAPRDRSTPKPEADILNDTVFDKDTATMQTDILKQSWDIAFNGASYMDDEFQTAGRDTALTNSKQTASDNHSELQRTSTPITASPNTSMTSEDRTCSPTESERVRAKKARTSFTTKQLRELEARYTSMRYIAATDRSALARSLGLTDQQVKTWFQNRRMKEKRNVQDGSESPNGSTPSPQNVPLPHHGHMTAAPASFHPLPPTHNLQGLHSFNPALGMVSSAPENGLYRPQPINVLSNGQPDMKIVYSQALPFPAMTSAPTMGFTHAQFETAQHNMLHVPRMVPATHSSVLVPQFNPLQSHLLMANDKSAFNKVSSTHAPVVSNYGALSALAQQPVMMSPYTPSFMGQLTGAHMPLPAQYPRHLPVYI